jgi:hypothetical protein
MKKTKIQTNDFTFYFRQHPESLIQRNSSFSLTNSFSQKNSPSAPSTLNQRKAKGSPTHFLSLPLRSHLLKQRVSLFQEQLIQNTNVDTRACMPLMKLHLTLWVLRLESDEAIKAFGKFFI